MKAVRIEPGHGALGRLGSGQGDARRVDPGKAGRNDGADNAAELRQAAQEFESFLLQQLLKQARSASRLLGGDTQPEMPGRDIFESWQDETYATAVSGAGGIGLADLLVQQLQPPPPRPTPDVPPKAPDEEE